ncbi:MAG: transglycosylase domain-containing protein [Marinilabiliaceae bacterium]|nr:transglycosylase domain-containing protein [Marinilabiliaceae bacterium]
MSNKINVDCIINLFNQCEEWLSEKVAAFILWCETRTKRQWIMLAVKSLVTIICLLLLLITLIYCGLFGHIPNEKELLSIKNAEASELYDYKGKLITRYYRHNRISVDSAEISKHVYSALIATEDSRFYEHSGVDAKSVGRVLFKTILMFDLSQGGGSTISQQLAKNLFERRALGPLTYPVAKIKEIIIAKRLEKAYSKSQILLLYLNTVPFGENVYGIEAASERFFSKGAKSLDVHEAALLVGMLAANSTYNPRLNPEKSLERRNIVLDRMYKANYIDSIQMEKYKAKEITLKYNTHDRDEGTAGYFRDIMARTAQRILNDTYGEGTYNIYKDGLKIYASLDINLQTYAEDALRAHLSDAQAAFNKEWEGKEPWGDQSDIYRNAFFNSHRYKTLLNEGWNPDSIEANMNRPIKMVIKNLKGDTELIDMSPADSVRTAVTRLSAGFLAVDVDNGHILAWVGDGDHDISQIDHVVMRRQVGSTFKPIVYASALENGIEATTYVENIRRSYPQHDNWNPGNSDGKYGGFYSLKGALCKSLNTVSAWLINEIGPGNVVSTARKLGIDNIPNVASIALGTAEISLYEMVHAYVPFATGGISHELTSLLRIDSRDGKILYKANEDLTGYETLTFNTATMVQDMMTAVVDSGTGRSLRKVYGLQTPLAGKTGTTQNGADGWFLGITPHIAVGAWMGADHPAIRFKSSYRGQGAYMALPIVGRFLTRIKGSKLSEKYLEGSFPLPDDEEMLIAMNYPTFLESMKNEDELHSEAIRATIAKGYSLESISASDTLSISEIINPFKKVFETMKGIFD